MLQYLKVTYVLSNLYYNIISGNLLLLLLVLLYFELLLQICDFEAQKMFLILLNYTLLSSILGVGMIYWAGNRFLDNVKLQKFRIVTFPELYVSVFGLLFYAF